MTTNQDTPFSALLITLLTGSELDYAGYRSVPVRYKEMEKGKGKPDSLHIYVPKLDTGDAVADSPAGIAACISSLLEDVQDSAIRAYIDELRNGGTKPVGSMIPERFTTLAELVTFFQREQVSKRLNGETIGKFFDASMAQGFVLAIMEKQPNMKDEDVQKLLALYRGAYEKLAAVNPKLTAADATKLKNNLEKYATAEAQATEVCKQIVRRLDLVINPKEVFAIDAL